uniref:Transmembrane protein n=1 Tax=Rhabditophanes sp. KR3021 TaxID=114890 RepID=A0AC35UC65_9BILA
MLISSTVEDSYKKADPVMITQKKSFLGNFIGKYSKYFVILWFLIFGSSFSFFFDLPNKPTQPDLTFTKIDASARREVLANVQFFGGKGEPFYMGFFARAINGKNMMDSKLFTQFEKIYRKTEKFILTDDANNTLSINNSNNTIKPTTFLDICEPFCTFNEVLFGFMNGRDTAMLLSMFTEPPMINYPTTSLFGYNINIGKHLFERSYDERKSMIGANISALYYTTMVTSPRKKALLLSFEEQVIRLVTEHNSNQSRDFDLVCIGEARVAVNFSIFFLLTPLLVYFKKSAQGHVYDNGQQNGAKDRTKKKKAVVGMFKKIFSLGIADILTSGCGKCFSFVLIVICVIIIPSVKISDISVGLDLRQLVKSDSLSVDGFDIVEKTVWPDSLSTVFIIERPPDFTNESQFIAFKGTLLKNSNQNLNVLQNW